MVIDHIGIAVTNIDKAVKEYQILGFKVMKDLIIDSSRNIMIQFLENEQGYCLELIEIYDKTKDSPINVFIEKNNHAIYHTCYKTYDLEKDIDRLHHKGYTLISKPESAIAFQQKRVCFLYNINLGIIELVEQ